MPNARLFAPRVALAIGADDHVLVDSHGDLPAADLDIGESLGEAARRLLELHRLSVQTRLHPLAVHTGPAWFEDHSEVGPIQPIWFVLGTDHPPSARTRLALRPAAELALLVGSEADAPGGRQSSTPVTGGDYVRTIRDGVGHERIFYPWAGIALRDSSGRLFLVRGANGGEWHCPGGGLEIGERAADAARRELEEETGLRAVVDGLIGCWSTRHMTFANGDRVQILATLLRGRAIGGVERADSTGEIEARGWFAPDELPSLRPPWDRHVPLVLHGVGTRFE